MSDKSLYESITETLDADAHSMRAWLALVSCFSSVERVLMRRLASEFNSSLPRYDVLTALELHPEGLTMGQLASKLMVSKGNITGVVRRLDEERLVVKLTSEDDRRIQLVTISPDGKELWKQMNEEYENLISEMLSGLSDEQADALAQSLLESRAVIKKARRGLLNRDIFDARNLALVWSR